ncbi:MULTISPECIES: trehalose operon repressor [unclassified Gemella]|uniref:trehalose operon repressor n=1 Tax=unclassified Gemella TaxID=2624949 RepID=UPI0015D084E4|nr:trehalose operon repressor [Gemella sp. GL1.1]NYS27994.1 trehalose operon repressor [Gemella sp. GL1]
MKKYQIVAKDLEKKITEGIYKANTFLPSEHALMEEYEVSRDTIRKALIELTNRHLIKKKRGAGSKVIAPKRIMFPVSELTAYTEIVDLLSLDSKTNVISISEEIISKENSRLTGFPIGTKVINVVRQRLVDDMATVYDIDYFDMAIVPTISRENAEASIYNYLENELHLDIDLAQKEITISSVKEMDKLLLDVGKDRHVVSVKSKSFLSNQKQFQFTESRHKLESFRFIDVARRKVRNRR